VAGQDFITAQEVKAQLDTLEEQQVRASRESPEPKPELT
jgi:hypothetical protein